MGSTRAEVEDIVLRIRSLLIACVLPMALGACSRNGGSPDFVQKVFGSQQVLDSFLASREVRVQRLHWRDEHLNPGILASYEQGQEVLVPSAESKQLQKLLQLPSSFDWGPYEKNCIVEYGLVFTFRSGPRTVRVALCFNCNWLGIFNGVDQSVSNINREMDFDPIRPQLIAIAKALYPRDPEIQSLKPKH